MEKNLQISLLLDIYSPVLSEKQRETIFLYYNEDLSLSEIAGNIGITRQGVYDTIKRTEALLFQLENEMKLYERFSMLSKSLGTIEEQARELFKSEELSDNEKACAEKILNTVQDMYDMI